ncbi:hypothetical protein SO802_000368 [Lithocarpus litseifolius]|uniref:Uncharacterized protein n=1 Tax=Lithocarpus litseifolius TaxID=425828 RepID=A0AAW2DV33_9ROSI
MDTSEANGLFWNVALFLSIKGNAAQSPDDAIKSYDEGDEEEVVDEDEGERENDDVAEEDGEESYKGTSRKMEAVRQRVRAAAGRKKEEERKTKGKEGVSSSAPKAITKALAKTKPDGKDNRPLKKVAVTLRDEHPKKSPPKSSRGAGKGVMTSSSPVVEGPCRLLTHKDYAVKEVESIIKPTDVEPCDQLGTEDLGASALFDLTRALVHVKALQDRCVAKEGVITRVGKHNKNLLDQQDQYKEAIRTLNGKLKEVKEKLKEAVRREQTLWGELTTLDEQLKKARADAVKEFKESQSFIDSCVEYYGTGFNDCLKQVASSYPDLDLSEISVDDPLPTTPAGDTVAGESDDSTESNLPHKDDGVVLAQPAVTPPVTTSNPPIEILDVENPHAQDKDDETLIDASAT